MEENKPNADISVKEKSVLIYSIFVAGLCSIVYELLISTSSSYFLGDSIKQFSITIGLYMASMGIGAYISRNFEVNLLRKFIVTEILLSLIGGLSIPILYMAFAFTDVYYPIMITLILVIGTLTGLEIPLITRLMEKYYNLKFNISNVFSLDYFGALIATLLFPFVLLPWLGVFNSSLVIGMVNLSIGIINLVILSKSFEVKKTGILYASSGAILLFLIGLMVYASVIMRFWENNIYEDRVIYSKQTKYQKIVVTKHKDNVRLYLNGNLQFSSADEYRYHESIVHVPLSTNGSYNRVLILGGGDGLAVKELIKYPSVQHIDLVDIDPDMTRICRDNIHISSVNEGSLAHPKLSILNQDAFMFLKKNAALYDLVLVDLPDPNNASLARLYSREFYKLIRKNIKEDGIFITQATSAFDSKDAFWCIKNTVNKAGFDYIYPFHAYVPAFGDWGFVMASNHKKEVCTNEFPENLRFLNKELVHQLFTFSNDALAIHNDYSTLDRPKILDYYLDSWKKK